MTDLRVRNPHGEAASELSHCRCLKVVRHQHQVFTWPRVLRHFRQNARGLEMCSITSKLDTTSKWSHGNRDSDSSVFCTGSPNARAYSASWLESSTP
jgi:hypothetical protein